MAQAQNSKLLNGERISLAILVLCATLLCGLPLLLLFKIGLTQDGALAFAPLAEALSSRSVQRALWHSMESSLLSALAATVLGTVLALIVGLTDIRAKGLLVFLILLPMMIPPHVTAIAWIQALGPASPVLRWIGLAPRNRVNASALFTRGSCSSSDTPAQPIGVPAGSGSAPVLSEGIV